MERWPRSSVIVAQMERNGEVGQGRSGRRGQSQADVFLKSKENILPEKRLPMRHTREILRLHFESHLARRQIATIRKVGKSTVQRYLERLKAAGLSWPLPADLDDVALERRLFPPPPAASPEQRCLPDCAAIHKERKSRKNVTLQLLWEEYRQANPLGYAYSWDCELYREWQRRLDAVLRHEPRAGEKTFVDYAGQTVPTSQLPVDSWHAQIGDPTIVDSILDRLVHNAYRIEMNGESMRKKNKNAASNSAGGRA